MGGTLHTLIVTTGIAVVLCAIALVGHECSSRNHQFRIGCVSNGGTLLEFGSSQACISPDRKTVTR